MPTPQELYEKALNLRRAGRHAEAVPILRTLAASHPQTAELHHQLGNALKSLARFEEALAPLADAARLAPDDAAVQLNLGVTNLELRRLPEATGFFRRAITLEPGRPEAHNILGNALFAQGLLTEARDEFETALRLKPDYAPAHDNLGRLCRAQGRMTEAVGHYRTALALRPEPATHSNLLLALNYLPDVAPYEIFAEHRRWAERYADPLSAQQPAPALESSAGRRLRIGYVSPDFSHHAVSYFFEPLLEAHDRSSFEVFCYSNVLVPDRVTDRLRKSAEHWRELTPLNDEQAAGLIRRDKLDILVDLAGHTARNRLLVFARRPAPIQLTWLGYPNTTGLAAMDARITDHVSDPVDRSDSLYSEKLTRLPGPFLCYGSPVEAPPVNALQATRNGSVAFGCFNNFAKVTPQVIALWAQILRALPGSRLFLKSRGLDDAETAARIRAAFAQECISSDRIQLDGRELSVAAHLSLYHEVDIALDTFPYNGTTTTCEALWMGVPVITLAGETHVARVGASLLTHLGHPEWIATSAENYREKALAMAADPPGLARMRDALRHELRASPLCDATGFARSIEAAYAKIVSDHVAR